MGRISELEYYNKLLHDVEPKYSYKIGDDICDFQRIGKSALAKLLGIEKIQKTNNFGKIEIEYDRFANDLGCREIRFTVESEKGVFVPCHLFVSKNCVPAPLILALHGHSTGMHVLAGRAKYAIDEKTIKEQECDFVKQALAHGFSALSIEHRGFGERGGNEKGTNCTEHAMRAVMLGRTLIGDRVWDAMTAINALCTNFSNLVDTNNIITIGYSGGGTIGTYLSALDKRIKTTVITSAICTFADSIGAMHHCACNYVPSMAENFDMGNICQLIAPRKLIIVSGDSDRIFPLKGALNSVEVAKTAYKAYDIEENVSHIIASGGHKFYPDEVWNALHEE